MPDLFSTIVTEGALLPPDFLQRLADLDKNIPGLRKEDFHLDATGRLNEAISQSWARALALWASFTKARAGLPESDLGTTVTREKWLLPLFQELGYGRLQTAKAVQIADKSYPVSHSWGAVPLHLVGFRVDLDHATPKAAGASRMSPHSLVQQLLNRSDTNLWAIVTNGLRLRILRDNASLTRQAYVEFDLEAMLQEEAYSDFCLFWLLCHQSRVEAERPEECWLEKWSQTARQEGIRALDTLRGGVEKALQSLGSGFISHPANEALRDQLRGGQLTTQDYFRQLLRTVYRMIFLFVAEDRDLLLVAGAPADARERYTRFYSAARIRRLAGRHRGTPHHDLWDTMALVMARLEAGKGCAELALPALGSFLWSSAATPDLNGAKLANQHLLDALRNLAYTEVKGVFRPVDYRNLGSEELGSIYESLLEQHPEIHLDAALFELKTAAGNERKTTGSYYTPTSLINCLLDSALDPVLDEAVKKPDPQKALLALRVCDPACGSGHFLVAAAHRIAKRLAQLRTGDEEPTPLAHRLALRDVIRNCLYGVDLNPLSVELCKVSLWLEALDPSKPLSFLDHHIRCGNSLLGATPRLLHDGIPDEAFAAITGDEKAYCTELRKKNKRERAEKGDLFDAAQPWNRLGDLAASMHHLDELPEDNAQQVEEKRRRYEELVRSSGYEYGQLWADAWCAAFVWKKVRQKDGGLPYALTEQYFRRVEHNPHSVEPWMKDEIKRLAQQYKFFHWHLAFPEVFRAHADATKAENQQTGWSGGFDCVLGNPPWDTLSPDQREFFGKWVSGLRSMSPEDQEREINRLLVDAGIATKWTTHCRDLFALVHFLKDSGVFTLYAPGNLGKGDFNIYRMFVETAVRHVRPNGYAAQVVPAGFYGGANASAIRKFMFDENRLAFLVGCENKGSVFFPGVHPQTWFALYAAQAGGRTGGFRVTFGVDAIAKAVSARTDSMALSADVIRQLAPDTYAIPDVRDIGQLATSQKMYAACPAFGEETLGVPRRHYCREVDMGNDRDLFTTDPTGLPVYEGRMIDHFDHTVKSYVSGHGNSAVWQERPYGDPAKAIVPQWRVLRKDVPGKLGSRCDQFRIGFCDVANPRNERSLCATLIPPGVICGDKVPTLDFGAENEWYFLPWLAVANSYAMDWLARSRLTAPKMAFSLLDSLPFPRPDLAHDLVRFTAPVVLRLVCTSLEMTPFWNRMAALGLVEATPEGSVPASALLEPSARELARAELDAYVAIHVFGLTRQEMSDVMDTFDVLRRREEKAYGVFRTKGVILEVYDAMQHAIATGTAYQTHLSPPPADPSVAHPPRVRYTERQVERGMQAAYAVTLLRQWGKPVAREALEPALILMLNDDIRAAILGGKVQFSGDRAIVAGFDQFLAGLRDSQFVEVGELRERQVLRPGAKAPAENTLQSEDKRKAQEAIQALEILKKDEKRKREGDELAFLQRVLDDKSILVSRT